MGARPRPSKTAIRRIVLSITTLQKWSPRIFFAADRPEAKAIPSAARPDITLRRDHRSAQSEGEGADLSLISFLLPSFQHSDRPPSLRCARVRSPGSISVKTHAGCSHLQDWPQNNPRLDASRIPEYRGAIAGTAEDRN